MRKIMSFFTILVFMMTILGGCGEEEEVHVVKITKEDKAVVAVTDEWIKDNIINTNKFGTIPIKDKTIIADNGRLKTKEFKDVILEIKTSGLGSTNIFDDHIIQDKISKSDDDTMHSESIHEILVSGTLTLTLKVDVYYKKYTDQYTIEQVDVKTIPNL
jgi:hypothetical protein